MAASAPSLSQQKPLFTRRQLAALLLPLVAEQTLSVTIGLADTLMVSSVGEAAVSGVSLVDTFNTLMIQIMSALATGGAVVTSQYIGHQEPKNAKSTAGQIMLVMLAFSCAVALVVVFGRHAILRTVFGAIDDDVMAYAETYFFMSALSYPFIGMYNAGAALFRAQGNSKISMLSSLVMNILNIGGNAIFIYGCGMAVFGAALATLISRILACSAVLYLLQRPSSILRVEDVRSMRPDRKLIRRILRIGIPNAIENGMFQIGKLSVSSLTSTLGTAAIAANAVANNTTTLLNIPANAVGMGALTVLGQCLGAGDKRQAKRYGGLMMLLAYTGAWIMNLAAFFGGNRFMLQFFNLSPDSTALALSVMTWFNIISLFIWHLAVQLHPAQHPARRRRRPLHHGGQHHLDVAVPRGAVLPAGGPFRRRAAGHLDRHVRGLGLPLPVLRLPLRQRQMDGAQRHLMRRQGRPVPTAKASALRRTLFFLEIFMVRALLRKASLSGKPALRPFSPLSHGLRPCQLPRGGSQVSARG